MMSLPPLKDQFGGYFLMGNIFNPSDISGEGASAQIKNERLVRHYNILTAENNMKPQYISSGQGSYAFDDADNMVNAAIASGFKVHGHTLLWHSQIPEWQKNMAGADRETALNAMKKYVTDVVSHFAGRIYSWDVLNEVFPDGVAAQADWKTSMRKTGDSQGANPWFAAIGSDFVYEGFLAARLADPSAVLYYNDYNTDQMGKATMIRDMVLDVNNRYKAAFPNAAHSNNGTRSLIEGIGMQEHHNTEVSVLSIRNTINLFRPLGIKLSVSELDILAQTYAQFRPIGVGPNRQTNTTVTNLGLSLQAAKYADFMKLYLSNSDIIERVSLWGVTDNQSWRSAGLPLLFDPSGKAKPAYYSFVGALAP
jgi:endo-1,4-beta-xylanase